MSNKTASNAPEAEELRQDPVHKYALEDRYTQDYGKVFLSGVQALARLPIEQLRVDRAAGHNTAAFVSGYQGSPLSRLDMEMALAAATVPDLPIVCRPAVNEELAATAVMGSQLAATRPDAQYDGVVGLWYGKAPGLDRACDALRHAVFAGTAPLGGAVAIVGDDPSAKSSSLPSSSDATFVDLHMPLLYPADVQEALDLGRHAIALSRASGLWVGLKIEASVADGTASVDLDPRRIQPVTELLGGEPFRCVPNASLIAARSLPVEQELRGIRTDIAIRYAAANNLNCVTVDPPDPWIGLVACGYTYREMLEALRRLGLDSMESIAAAGIRLMKMSMPIPFEPNTIRSFARGLSELFVIEEMNPTLERLIREALYHEQDRPIITGKHDPDGAPLLPTGGMLDADRMLEGVRRRLATRLESRLAPLPERNDPAPLEVSRSPHFCSGCPHNRSTRVPEGSLVGAGIGCHTMALLTDDERLGNLIGLAAMGNEGAAWIGMSEFVDSKHLFQNLGDGTFFHSGQLAIQAAVAAGINITYKLLYNGTVAMTGGQDPQGGLDVPNVVQILQAYGVSEILITTDDVSRYRGVRLPDDVEVWDRKRLIEAQERLAKVPGVTVLLHDQACAAESRRKRKRGLVPTPEMRVAINQRICEGCGDCARKSSCLSVEPVETPFGRKTRINQHSCNLDFSCLEGDCPAFMSVKPARRRSKRRNAAAPRSTRPPNKPISLDGDLPAPPIPNDPATWSIRMAGIGGTGVLTAAQILGTAATISGAHVTGLDQTGLSQKAGPVISDLRFTFGNRSALSNHVGALQADTLIAFDILAAASANSMDALQPGHTNVVGSVSATPTGSMITHPGLTCPPTAALTDRIARYARPDALWMDATRLSTKLTGTPVGANLFVVGAALQRGCIPIPPEQVEEAIRLNGVGVDVNLAAFRWGRLYAIEPEMVESVGADEKIEADVSLPNDLDERVDRICESLNDEAPRSTLRLFSAELVAFQNKRYAAQYLEDLYRVAERESGVAPGSSALTLAAAKSLYQLMAYKDEYEVARLMLENEGRAAAHAASDAPVKMAWRLHPPLLRALGLKRKIAVPEWTAPLIRVLSKGKILRGSPLDIFGYAEVRRLERALVPEYRAALERIIADLSAQKLDEAVRLATLPQQVRGYEDLKLQRASAYRAALETGLDRFCDE